jgi:hypothetical protein
MGEKGFGRVLSALILEMVGHRDMPSPWGYGVMALARLPCVRQRRTGREIRRLRIGAL